MKAPSDTKGPNTGMAPVMLTRMFVISQAPVRAFMPAISPGTAIPLEVIVIGVYFDGSLGPTYSGVYFDGSLGPTYSPVGF